jgi:hypothetical protein
MVRLLALGWGDHLFIQQIPGLPEEVTLIGAPDGNGDGGTSGGDALALARAEAG